MEISISRNTAILTASGIQFLRLKTDVVNRLGNKVKASKDSIEIPISTLPLITDLLDVNILNTEEVQSVFQQFVRHGEARELALNIVENGMIQGIPQYWTETLDPAQATAVSAMILPDILGICLFDEQGSGKTVMSIASFDILHDEGAIDAMIVICPKSMVTEWPKDINRFTGEKYRVITADGDREQKYNSAFSHFDIIVTNYEGVEVMLTPLIAVSERKRFLIVVDESFYLKNDEAVRSVNTQRLRMHCARSFVLCGTPAPNSAHDLINQFDLADLGYTFGGFSKSNDPTQDYNAIADLIETRGLFIRRLKTDILQAVPDKNFHVISIDLSGRQREMYENARNALVIELQRLDNTTFRRNLATYFQRRAALLQICSCPTMVDPTFPEIPAKYSALDTLLNNLFAQGRKVLVWSFFTKCLDEIQQRYNHIPTVRVDGTVPVSDRKNAVIAFQTYPEVLLFLGNPAAAGAGITLHAAYDAVYVSYSNQAAHYLQSLDRIHRRGQVSNIVNYYLFVCNGTIEQTEMLRLREKEVRQQNLLGDQIQWPTSLDDALNELTADV